MKMQHLLEAFDRGEHMAREAWTQDQMVDVIRQLRKLTMQYIGHTKLPQLQRRSVQERIEVGSLTRWG